MHANLQNSYAKSSSSLSLQLYRAEAIDACKKVISIKKKKCCVQHEPASNMSHLLALPCIATGHILLTLTKKPERLKGDKAHPKSPEYSNLLLSMCCHHLTSSLDGAEGLS